MSIQSGVGQIPSIFSSGGGTPLNPALSLALPFQNNGSVNDGGTFNTYPSATVNLSSLLPNTTYRVFITLSCLPDTGFVPTATIDAGVVFYTFTWQSGAILYSQQLIITPIQSFGTLIAQGQITTSSADYIWQDLSLSSNWTASNPALDLLTAGQIYIEPI